MISLDVLNKTERKDEAQLKRVELHCHTNLSALEGISSVQEYVDTAVAWNMEAIAITDENCIQAFPEAYGVIQKMQDPPKIILGADVEMLLHNNEKCFITVLVKNEFGRTNLYKLITESHKEGHSHIDFEWLKNNRNGLIIGYSGLKGLYQYDEAILSKLTKDEIDIFDYFEVFPESSFFDIENKRYEEAGNGYENSNGLKSYREVNDRIIEFAESYGKMIVATSNAYYVDPEDILYRRILVNYNHFPSYDKDFYKYADFYLRTTDEMLEEFEYLGKEKAYEIVIGNTRKIADMVEDIPLIRSERYMFEFPETQNTIRRITEEKLKELYGNILPDNVKRRYDAEMAFIVNNKFENLFMLMKKVADDGKTLNLLTLPRGCIAASFVVFLLGIIQENPLEWNIPFETLAGIDMNKEPSIEIDVATDYHNNITEMFQNSVLDSHVVRAGTIERIGWPCAKNIAFHYFRFMGIALDDESLDKITSKISQIKVADEVHPAGFFIIPKTIDTITPFQTEKQIGRVTHFPMWELKRNLVGQLYIENNSITMLKRISELVNVDPFQINYKTQDIINAAIGGSNFDTTGIIWFDDKRFKDIATKIKPKTLYELGRTYALAHGTDVWENNAELLIDNNIADFSDIITCRDDIMNSLILYGISREKAYEIMESVRKGRGLKPEHETLMRSSGIPEWYIESCNTIKYLFPLSHCAIFVSFALRLVYLKLHFPEAFIQAYREMLTRVNDENTMLQSIK